MLFRMLILQKSTMELERKFTKKIQVVILSKLKTSVLWILPEIKQKKICFTLIPKDVLGLPVLSIPEQEFEEA